MANIVPSDAAPDETVHYAFAGVEFDLAPGDTYASDDGDVISNAGIHPWLTVEVDETQEPVPTFSEQLDPQDDHLSAVGGIDANNPALARQAEEDKARAAGFFDTDDARPAPDTSEVVINGPDAEPAPDTSTTPDDPNLGES